MHLAALPHLEHSLRKQACQVELLPDLTCANACDNASNRHARISPDLQVSSLSISERQ